MKFKEIGWRLNRKKSKPKNYAWINIWAVGSTTPALGYYNSSLLENGNWYIMDYNFCGFIADSLVERWAEIPPLTQVIRKNKHYAIMSPYLEGRPVGCTWGRTKKEAQNELQDEDCSLVRMSKKKCSVCSKKETIR